MKVQGVRCRVEGEVSGCRVKCLLRECVRPHRRFGSAVLGLRVEGLRFRVEGLGFRVEG